MRDITLLLVCMLFLSGRIALAQTTITVGQSGSFDFSTIEAAIGAARSGDTIIVFPGIYYEYIHIRGKNIILRSTDPTDTATVAATVIDGNSSGPVVMFAGTETSSCVLSGFTIRNGRVGYGSIGGGIYSLGSGTHATIQYNIIADNSSINNGGGINFTGGLIQYNTIIGNESNVWGGGVAGCSGIIQYNRIIGNLAGSGGGGVASCDGTIRNNVIADNEAGTGGGGLDDCNGTIENNIIIRNEADFSGGGLHDCNGTIQNNTISNNFAQDGGGLSYGFGAIRNNVIAGNRAWWRGGGLHYWAWPGGDTTATIENNTICNNSAASGGALYRCKADIVNCILWGNTAASSQTAQLFESTTPTYSCIQDWAGGGEGNIASYPWFADADYYLLPQSPCVDAGNPAPEYNDACRPPALGASRNDMGAYGGPYNCLWPAPLPSLRTRNWCMYE